MIADGHIRPTSVPPKKILRKVGCPGNHSDLDSSALYGTRDNTSVVAGSLLCYETDDRMRKEKKRREGKVRDFTDRTDVENSWPSQQPPQSLFEQSCIDSTCGHLGQTTAPARTTVTGCPPPCSMSQTCRSHLPTREEFFADTAIAKRG